MSGSLPPRAAIRSPSRPSIALDPIGRSVELVLSVESECGAVTLGQACVWRCLSGSTIAPFPHPAHRTGHADLSGSAAIAGFCPDRTHRAALPQWALQEGPDA